MSEQDFQQQVLTELQKLNGKIDTLEGKVDTIASDLHEFKENQEQFNQHLKKKTDTLWSLSNQSFSAISDVQKKMGDMGKYVDDIHQETISPWKRRKTQAFVV
jgi:predicted  nucleic acid-binding Zn-ribbon protein